MAEKMIRTTLRRAVRLAALACAIAPLTTVSYAADQKMPSGRFAAILGRLLTYDSNLKGRAGSDIGIAVLYRPASASSLAEANQVFDQIRALEGGETLELPVKVYKLALESEGELEKAAIHYGLDVFVITDGMTEQTEIVKRVSARRKIITVGSDGSQARQGLSVAIYVSDDKSKILVNLGASKREGTSFNSVLLGMCEVIP